MKKTLLFLASMFLSQSVLSQNIEAATRDACGCLEGPYALAESMIGEMSDAQASGNFNVLLAKQGEIMEVMDSYATCFESLPEKYPKIRDNQDLQHEVMKNIEKTCPSPFEALTTAL